jgi:thiol-disulfide isomerase/thioredoxin
MLVLLLVAIPLFAEDSTGIPGLEKVPKNIEEAKVEADRLEKLYAGKTQPESVRMLIAIARGSQMGSGDGWFGPAQKRHDFAWLAKRCGVSPKAGIPRDKFPGSDAWFARLDRDKSGEIRAEDFDWSERNPYNLFSSALNRIFRQIDVKGSGRISKEEWMAFFDKAAKDKDHLTPDDLRDSVLKGLSGGYLPGDAPTPEILLRGLFANEVGSLQEGPKVGENAPNFELKSVDRKTTVNLANVIGKRPVVLVFGNFTCGPFRSLYPGVEEIQRRYAKDATFLMVYVREAHPTDGWRMKANDRVGVSVSQPKTTEARCEAAGQFAKKLDPKMPLLVDEVDDKVGNAYSGMPARLYVLDEKGKVTYKSGRGPFGFKVGEMEQALIMTLLESSPKKED